MELGIADHAAVVMGADSGIGFAIATLMCADGARIVLTGSAPAAAHFP